MLDLTTAFAQFPTLTTRRWILRAPTAHDVEDIYQIMSDPRVIRYFGSLPMTTREQAAERVASFQRAFAEQSGIRWAISEPRSGRLIGTCGYWRIIKPHCRAEIGYELASEWWGQGVMPEALSAVLAFGFTTMGLHTVEAQIHPENGGSRRVLEKLGFVQEGYFRENYFDLVEDRFTDTAVFSLLKRDWLSHSRAGSDPASVDGS